MLSEISQAERDKYHMISLKCGILKTRQNQTKPSLWICRTDWQWPELGHGEWVKWAKVSKAANFQLKNEFSTYAATWTTLEEIMLSEISQAEKDKYDFTHMWNLRNKTD